MVATCADRHFHVIVTKELSSYSDQGWKASTAAKSMLALTSSIGSDLAFLAAEVEFILALDPAELPVLWLWSVVPSPLCTTAGAAVSATAAAATVVGETWLVLACDVELLVALCTLIATCLW